MDRFREGISEGRGNICIDDAKDASEILMKEKKKLYHLSTERTPEGNLGGLSDRCRERQTNQIRRLLEALLDCYSIKTRTFTIASDREKKRKDKKRLDWAGDCSKMHGTDGSR